MSETILYVLLSTLGGFFSVVALFMNRRLRRAEASIAEATTISSLIDSIKDFSQLVKDEREESHRLSERNHSLSEKVFQLEKQNEEDRRSHQAIQSTFVEKQLKTEERLASVEKQYDEALAAQTKRIDDLKTQMETDHSQEIEKLNQNHRNEVAEIKRQHAEEVSELKEQLNQANARIKELETAVATLKARVDEAQADPVGGD